MRKFLGLEILLLAKHLFADLPVHCLLNDVVGLWRISFSRLKVELMPSSCRSSVDVNPGNNIDVNLFKVENSVNKNEKGVLEVDNSGQELQLRYKASFKGADTSWTMIYDDGLVIHLGDARILYGHFGYKATTDPPKPEEEGFVTAEGTTPGFESECGAVLYGWVINKDESLSCFTAKRVDYITDTGSSKGLLLRRSNSMQGVKPLLAGISEVSAKNAVDEFTSKWTKQVTHSEVQGSKCGSCFVFAFAYALERIASKEYLTRIDKTSESGEPPLSLDREVMLSCAYSSQGCNGGYFNSLSLDISYTGARLVDISSQDCLTPKGNNALSTDTGKAKECDFSKCFINKSKLIYTKGFRELHSDEEIMESLRRNGPVLVGVRMALKSADTSREKIYEVDPFPGRGRNEGWDFIDHGLTITGWGEDSPDQQFWHVFNPWGTMMKIARGKGHERIAKYAMEVILDTSRGFFKPIAKEQ
jgi:hypothetical protein